MRKHYPLLTSTTFLRFWTSDAVSMFGTYVTAQALQVLAILTLAASAFELGMLRAAQWLPYLLFGLVAGVFVDRYRRKPILVGADVLRAVLLAAIPISMAAGVLTIAGLIGIVFAVGLMSLVYEAAHQSFLPSLVPKPLLAQANARLEQTSAVAQVGGQAFAGYLIRFAGAPMAILVDAGSYLVSAVLLAGVRVDEADLPPPPGGRSIRAELAEGWRWVYRHHALAPLALASHAWFLFTSMVSAIYAYFVIRELGFDAGAYGATLAVGGVGAIVGSSLALRAGDRFGVGPVVVAGMWLAPVGYGLVALADSGFGGLVVLAVAQFVFWFSVGISSPLEMAYRQAVTPGRLLGRVNATMRSMNRAAVVIGGAARWWARRVAWGADDDGGGRGRARCRGGGDRRVRISRNSDGSG